MITYITAPEIMHGMGIVYWHHSIMQVTLPLQIMAFIKMKDGSKRAGIAFFILVLVNPYIEWTGYVANAGYALYELFVEWKCQ